ncbi:cytochrome c oxidase assembly protein [Pseudonocardia hydrocarbonoxydans]|uniref:Cytochrome c oxidase assembly protein n=1 Tax=Pseudonocardia hydrocarbonoxydans TaxID=76726 RepID=A0A4Y3WTJ4_9PSEU|nr:cytochrome c oxidase assembly protein [Pseudonocardia hydrocarbonoxydans]GEC21420.1 hypothetical protein PHY01_37030 [Pseudonocardia hydrocarbonoxydans]
MALPAAATGPGRGWPVPVALTAVAFAVLVLLVVAAPATSGPDLDLAGNALLLHVVAASVWLAAEVRRPGGAPRPLAAGCWAVLALSGAAAAWVLGRPTGTAAGVPVLVDLVVVAALGLVTVRRWGGRGVRTGLLAGTLAATAGLLAVPPARPSTGPVDAAIGYPLPVAPTLPGLLATWRPDLLFGVVALVAVVLYAAGVRRLRRAGRPWPAARTAAWAAGWAVVVLATSSGVGVYGPAVFSSHMVAHMALNMIAPLALVLGAPVTLALRALVPADEGRPPGPHERLLALVDSRPARLLAHPGLAAVLFAGSYYLFYLTGLFETLIAEHWSRTALSAVVLVIGYQFCWVVVGADAAPRRLPHLGRLGVVFAVMPFHVVFAILLITRPTAVAAAHYAALGLPWSLDLLADQRLAGVLSLVLGELMLVTAQVVLLVQWHRHDQLAEFRADPADEDAAAHRDLLDTLRRSRTRPD